MTISFSSNNSIYSSIIVAISNIQNNEHTDINSNEFLIVVNIMDTSHILFIHKRYSISLNRLKLKIEG